MTPTASGPDKQPADEKAPGAFRSISEASSLLGLAPHVLRHWEDTFGAIRPMRRAGGRRFYRPHDVALLAGVKALLHGERYTTKGVQKLFKTYGPRFVAEIGKTTLAGTSADDAVTTALAQAATASATASAGASAEDAAAATVPLEDLERLRDQLHAIKRELQLLTGRKE